MLSSPTAPFFDIELDTVGVDPHMSMGAAGLALFRVLIRGCTGGPDIAAQDTLDQWTATSGATSVKALLEADQTLNGVAEGVKVISVAGYRGVVAKDKPGNEYLGAEWTVEIYTTG